MRHRLIGRCNAGGLVVDRRSPGAPSAATLAPALGRRRRPAARDAWRMLPGDLLGGLAVALSGAAARRLVAVRNKRAGSPSTAVVVEDPRLGPFLDRVPLRPVALTFGRYVLARRPLPDATLRHELEHVRQWSRLGPLFLPAYLADSLRVQLGGGDRYADNRFEAAARAREAAPDRSRPLDGVGGR